jgi:hypothetical protein
MCECHLSCKNIQTLSDTLLNYIHLTVCWRKWRNAVCGQSTFGALTVTNNEIWLWQITALVCESLWVRDTVFWDRKRCNLLEIYRFGQIYWLQPNGIPKTKFARGDYVLCKTNYKSWSLSILKWVVYISKNTSSQRTISVEKPFTNSSLNLFIISVPAKFGDVIHDVTFDPLTSFDKTRKTAPLFSNTDTTRSFSCIRRHTVPCLRITLRSFYCRPEAPQMSWIVSINTGFLCDGTTNLGAALKKPAI